MLFIKQLMIFFSMSMVIVSAKLEGFSIFCNNATVTYGEERSFVVTLKKIPSGIYTYRVISKTGHLLMDRFQTNPRNEGRWRYTNNITKILEDYEFDEAPFEKGFYFIVKNVFFEYEPIIIVAEVFELERETMTASTEFLLNYVAKYDCLPVMKISKCWDARNPRETNIAEFAEIIGVLLKECSDFNNKNYKWSLYDSLGTKLLHKFSSTIVPRLKIQPYFLNFRNDDEFNRFYYRVKLVVKIANLTIHSRCYLKVLPSQVHAVITGGPEREVDLRKRIIVDGSKSKDYSHPGENSAVLYKWSCSSFQDPDNRLCNNLHSKAATVTLPAYYLQQDLEYNIKLIVTSNFDHRLSSATNQLLRARLYSVIQVTIECVDNCALDYYDPNLPIELKANCLDCDPTERLFFEWFVDDTKVGESESLSLRLDVMGASTKIKVKVTSGLITNTDTKSMVRNNGPTGGTCSIAPKTGLEVTTRFRITCQDFYAIHSPLEYLYISKKVILVKCEGVSCAFVLPVTNYVIVRICDQLMMCFDVTLDVIVTPIEIPTDIIKLREFLKTDPYNVKELLRGGQSPVGLAILNSLATRIKQPNQAQVLLDQFEGYQPSTAIGLGKMANMTRTMTETLLPLSEDDTRKITKSLKILNDNFEIIINDGEYIKLGMVPYLNITQSCVTMLDIFTNVVKALVLPPKHISDYVKAKYPNLTKSDYEKLEEEINQITNPKVMELSKIWLAATKQLERLFNYLDFAERHDLEADEKLIIITEGVSLDVQCFNVDEQRFENGYSIMTRDGINTVNFSPELLYELSAYLKSNRMCMQVLSIIRNLNWWFPEERQPSSRILSVHVSSDIIEFKKEIKIRNKLNFFILIGKYRHSMTDNIRIRTNFNELGLSKRKDLGELVNNNNNDNDDSYNEKFWFAEPGVNLLSLIPDELLDKEDDDDDDDNKDGYINKMNNTNNLETLNDKRYTYLSNQTTIKNVTHHKIIEKANLKQNRYHVNSENNNKPHLTELPAWILNMKSADPANVKIPIKKRENSKENNKTNEIYDDFETDPDDSKPSKGFRVAEDSERVSSAGKFRNCLVKGSLRVHEQTLVYRATLDARSLLAVRFMNITHDINALMTMQTFPRRLEIARQGCILRKNSTRTLLLRNNCMDSHKVYLGLRVYSEKIAESCSHVNASQIDQQVANGPANFSFIFQIRACDAWIYSAPEPHWASSGCIPGLDFNIGYGLRCVCDYISTYTGYVYNMIAIPVPIADCSYSKLPVKFDVVLFHLILWLTLYTLVVLLYVFKSAGAMVAECTLNEREVDLDEEPHTIMIHLTTGGQLLAGTTANIKFVLQMTNGDELEFTLFQDPEHPSLIPNSTHTVRLISRDIRLPTTIAVSHDNAGRYPKWFCSDIVLEDLQTQQFQEFKIQHWVDRNSWVVSSGVLYEADEVAPVTKWKRFRKGIEENFINWFMFQPLLGNWQRTQRYRTLTRYERSCVWIVKFSITICIVAIYYGRTSVDNYEAARERYASNTLFNFVDVSFLVICCFASNVVVHYIYDFFVIPFTGRLG